MVKKLFFLKNVDYIWKCDCACCILIVKLLNSDTGPFCTLHGPTPFMLIPELITKDNVCKNSVMV